MSVPAAALSVAPPSLRAGRVDDVSALLEIEAQAYAAADRLSRRSFLHMLGRAHAALTVAEDARGVLGYSLVLLHAGTSLARLYSLAVRADARRQGIGLALLHAAEAAAVADGCVSMRIEVAPQGDAAAALLERAGYRALPRAYQTAAGATRFEKRIAYPGRPTGPSIPFLRQHTDFTCGPACLLMAMQALQPTMQVSASTELALWREATTIFMTSGHGGCGPLGLALAAWRRGFAAEVWLSEAGPLFLRTVRDPRKKAVLRQVHEDFAAEVATTGIRMQRAPLSTAGLADALARGGVPLVLISQYRMRRQKAPHWIVVTGVDDRFVYAHDPDVDADAQRSATDCIHVPIARREFDRMARFGQAGLRAAVVVSNRVD